MTTSPTNPDGVALMTDRRHLTTAAYGNSVNLSARQAIYAFQEPAIDFPAWALALTPIGEGATVLDVGCGNGVYLRRLAARPAPPARLLGLDLSRGMLD
jgi:cyclopropane fatty-acyl-phospholipid synthase-like methyltransferase